MLGTRRGFLGLLGLGSTSLVVGNSQIPISPVLETQLTQQDRRLHIKKVFSLPYKYDDFGYGFSRPNQTEELFLRESIGILECLEDIRSDLSKMRLKGKILVELQPHCDCECSYIYHDGILNARYIREYDLKDNMIGSVDICLVDVNRAKV